MPPPKKYNKTWVVGDVGFVEIDSPTYGIFTVKVDADRLDEVRQSTWTLRWSHGLPRYAATTTRVDGKQKTILMQCLLFPCPDGMVRDHINTDGFDNRSDNIRIVTPSHNSLNLSKRVRKHGVQLNSHGGRSKRYAARLSLGTYETEDEAHEAWKSAYKSVFGKLPECVDA